MALYIHEAGLSKSPTIVFLHGGGVSGWMWQPQVDQLGDYHCLVPDLPEHGRSIAEKPFSIRDSATRVAELIRTRAHGGRAHFVGLSLGAQTTVQLLSTKYLSANLHESPLIHSREFAKIRGSRFHM